MLYKDIQDAIKNCTADIEIIEPTTATAMLATNIGNRTPSNANIRRLTDAMENNQWMFNGESIIIGSNGLLLNGQNRLMAVEKSNETIVSVVVRGVDPVAFKTMDQGQKRTVAQILGILFKSKAITVSSNTVAGAVLKSLKDYYDGEYGNMGGTGAGFTGAKAEAEFQERPDVITSLQFANTFGRAKKKSVPITHTAIAVAHYILVNLDSGNSELQEMAEDFLTVICTGRTSATYKSHNTDLLALRDYLMNQPLNGSAQRCRLYGTLFKSWNRYINDVHLQKKNGFVHRKSSKVGFPTPNMI